MIRGISNGTELILGIGGVFALFAAWWRWVRPRWKHAKAIFVAFCDAILGREEIRDPETGRELSPAKPGIGTRMANTEATLTVLTEAVAKIADTGERMNEVEKRQNETDRRLNVIETVVGVERALKQVESIELLRTMDSAINADPGEHRSPRDHGTAD